MAFLFRKFQEAAQVLAKHPLLVRDPRHLQFEADINRLFLFTSYYRLGRNADEKDINEIIDIGSKASIADQQKQVEENVHFQVKNLCDAMDNFLQPNFKRNDATSRSRDAPRPSGLSLAVGGQVLPSNQPAVPETVPLTRSELSQSLKGHVGYTLGLKPSLIQHEEAGQGLFLSGKAGAGSVVGIYPGIVYSPSYYQHIPGYPRIDASNSYLITRYDGIIINAQPWGFGGESREQWNGSLQLKDIPDPPENIKNSSDRLWRILSKPLPPTRRSNVNEILERRNPLALAHFANHPGRGQFPNVMVCPYNFPVMDDKMRAYIPNIVFGPEENVRMKRFGSFWFKSGSSAEGEANVPMIKTLLLVATRDLSDEELLLNYRLSNSKRCPAWYTPVDEEEDKRRWS